MVGTKLYQKKARVYFLLAAYGALAIVGVVMAAQAVSLDQNPSAVSGFMAIFGAGMFFLTLVKSRNPQVAIHEDFLELRQSRKTELVRYRNIVSVSQPDKNRLVVKLWEDNFRKDMTIWTRELEKTDIEKLMRFLSKKGRKAQ